MKVSQTQFDGGRAQDPRRAGPNQYSLAHHFDVSQKHKLIPYRDMESEGSLSAYKIGSVCLFTDSAGTQKYFALGSVSGQNYPQILEKTNLTDTFATSTSGNGTSGTVIRNSLLGYKNQNKLYFLKNSGSSTIILGSYNPASDTLAETVGTISDVAVTGIYPKPFVHPLDDIMYMAAGSTVAKLDGSTFTASAVTIPSHLEIVNLVDYGPFLAITAIPIDAGGRSVLFLWGRDTSIVEMDEAIDLGEGAAMVTDNIQGRLLFASAPTYAAGTAFDFYPTIVFRQYAGGVPQTLHEMRWEGTGTPTALLKNIHAKHKDDLYFSLSTYLNDKTVNQVWRCGFNESGQFFVTPDRLANNNTALTGNVDSIDFIGDVMFTAVNSFATLMRTDDAATFTNTATLETGVLFSGEEESVVGFTVHFLPLASGASVTLKYKMDAETTYTSVILDSTKAATANSMRADAVSDQFTRKTFKQISFQINSVNATITGWEFVSKPVASKSYAG